MKKVLIFGNSGSGKTTFAKHMASEYRLAHLDLDTIAWQPTSPPLRQPISKSHGRINSFCGDHHAWVIEGCYADLLELASRHANELIFMDISIEQCIDDARSRPWEAHKYSSKEVQDQNLDMLITWIENYETRDDEFSRQAHQSLYRRFDGEKRKISNNLELS